MFKQNAMLFLIFAATMRLAIADSSANVSAVAVESSWTASQVAQWAADHSPAAKLLESEQSAMSASYDRDNREQRAQVALVQKVIPELVCHERNRAAAQALTAYYQLAGLHRQLRLLEDAHRTLEQLLRMADKANELELKDGNRSELDKQRLQIADQQSIAAEAAAKLTMLLAQLTGKPYTEAVNITLAESPNHSLATHPLEEWIAIAYAERCDLKAIESLCRSLSTDSLPAARQILAALQPGLGLALAVASNKHLLAALHQEDKSGCELYYRREQCAGLRVERRQQVETQVRIAFIEHETSKARLKIAEQQADIDSQLAKQSVKAIELDQAKPGTDLLANLELFKAKGTIIERQVALNGTAVKLQEVTGTVLSYGNTSN